MLRIYFLQHCTNLPDPGAEDVLYGSPALRGFAGVDPSRAAAPDDATILHFLHLLEANDLCGQILDTLILNLGRKGNPVSSKQTQERPGWRPTHPGILSDLNHSSELTTG
jgi:IS5 family transposase